MKDNLREVRALALAGTGQPPRVEYWEGREHLVVPIVALMEGVIQAANAPEPEYVPLTVLEQTAQRWNGHPLVINHPRRGEEYVSAHDAGIMARQAFGVIRSSPVRDAKLAMEALVDPARLVVLGHQAMLADIRAGRPIPVSVGAGVDVQKVAGAFRGKRYGSRWSAIEPDHLAFLPGGEGACSVEMGCGACRAAATYVERHQEDSNVKNTIIDSETLRCLRDIPQSERDSMKASDFAGPDQSFPIKTQADVNAAAKLIGKAADPAAVKAKIIAIAKRKGLTLPDAWKVKATTGFASLKERMLALFDTPEAAAAEEAAELVAYNSMRSMLDSCGDQWDETSQLVDDLIADETEDPTETRAQEDAEETVEEARLDAVRMHCYSMVSTLQSIISMTYAQQAPDAPEPSDPRYAEAFRAAVGKAISAKNMKTIQSAHDASHSMHGHTVALGAECNGMRLMAKKMVDCPTCDGTGQVKDGTKQQDCPTCDGTGQVAKGVKAAERRVEDGGEPAMEDQMKKVDAIKALTSCPCSGFTEADAKQLEGFTEERLTALAESAAARKKADDDLRAAQTKAEADLRAAQAAQIPAEELTSLRALAAERDQRDATEKNDLVKRLAAASKTLTEEQLKARSLADLRTLASFAKLEAPVAAADYSGRGIPVNRAAESAATYAAPDGYANALKAHRAAESKSVN